MTIINLFESKQKIGSIEYIINKKSRVCTIIDLYIDPEYRNRGYGTRLIKKVIKNCKKCNTTIRKIVLDDMTDINGVNNIYYKCGFQYDNYKFGPEMTFYL